MSNEEEHHLNSETSGAWIVHHGQKVSLDAHGASEFPAIDTAAKAAGLNPKIELKVLLNTLEQKRLIERKDQEISVFGITNK